MPALYPSAEEIEYAISETAAFRREQARNSAQWALASAAALEERITAYPVKPEALGFGWWMVGVLVDETDPEWCEYSIMVVPGKKTLRTPPRYYVERPAPPKPQRKYYSGATKRWEINPNVPEEAERSDVSNA